MDGREWSWWWSWWCRSGVRADRVQWNHAGSASIYVFTLRCYGVVAGNCPFGTPDRGPAGMEGPPPALFCSDRPHEATTLVFDTPRCCWRRAEKAFTSALATTRVHMWRTSRPNGASEPHVSRHDVSAVVKNQHQPAVCASRFLLLRRG